MSLISTISDACKSLGYCLSAFEQSKLRECEAIVRDGCFYSDLPDGMHQMSPYVRKELFYYILNLMGDCININEGMRFGDINVKDYVYGLDFSNTSVDYEHLIDQLAASYAYKSADDNDEEDSDYGGVDEFGSLHIVQWIHDPVSLSMLFKAIIKFKKMSVRARHAANAPGGTGFVLASHNFKRIACESDTSIDDATSSKRVCDHGNGSHF